MNYYILHGGGWNDDAIHCRTAYRDFNTPGYRSFNVGFRLIKKPKQ